jgi:enoyl-CoA hydratase/carnithine racemase
MHLDGYRDEFSTAALNRNEAGVLTVRLHSKGESLWWGARPHRELPELFAAIASDRDNRVVIITGTGDSFIEILESSDVDRLPRGRTTATNWDQTIYEGNRLVNHLLDIEVPVIAAVNGPVAIHSEIAVLADIVLCTEQTYFQDRAHFPLGMVPGDSMQVVWPMLLGPNRGRAFLLTGSKLHADEALRLGVVAEVLADDRMMARADEIAGGLAELNPVLLRNTRQVLVRPIKRAMADDLHVGLALEAVASLSGREFFNNATDDD